MTFTAGSVLTAAQLNTYVSDNLTVLAPLAAAWTSWTPTLSQGASTNIAKTVTYAKYVQVGKTVYGAVRLDATGTGTANADIYINCPVSPDFNSVSQIIVGSGYYYRAAGPGFYVAPTALFQSALVLVYGAGGAIGRNPNFAVGNGDQFAVSFTYEAA